MTKKYFKLLLSLGIILCVLCGSFTITMAAPRWGNIGELETDIFEDTEVETTADMSGGGIGDFIGGDSGGIGDNLGGIGDDDMVSTTNKPTTTRPQKPKPNNTVNNTVKETEKTTKETTKKPEKTTKEESTTKVVTETVDPDEALLPEGSFFVYLERNNGERRLRTVLDKPGLVNQPNEPVRLGYIFKGWYKDPEFKTPWDFNKSIAQKGTVIYAKWEPDGDTIEYKIKVQKTVGGSIEVNPASASVGEAVIITVKPDEGKRLVAGSITINGKSSSVLSFIMPREEVVVGASFEDIPEYIPEEDTDSEETIVIPIVIAVAIFAAIAVAVVVIIIKYKTRPAVIEYDENGAVILDDDDDDGWVDDSIVIEDGFLNGRIVRESGDSDDTEIGDSYDTEPLNLFETENLDSYDTESLD